MKSRAIRKSLLLLEQLAMAAALFAPVAAPADGYVSEVTGGVLNHDVRFAGGIESGVDFNAEVMVASPFDAGTGTSRFVRALMEPRPAVGVEINSAGATSQLYAMAVWTFAISSPRTDQGLVGRYFVRIGGGSALNNGTRDSNDSDRKSLGSHLLFHVSGEVGARISRHVDLSLYFDHSSNAGLCRSNDSINDLGIRLGWFFGNIV